MQFEGEVQICKDPWHAPPAPAGEGEQGTQLFCIVYEDADKANEILVGEAVARKRFAEIGDSWNAHLFVKIESNVKDDPLDRMNAPMPAPSPLPAGDDVEWVEPVAVFDRWLANDSRGFGHITESAAVKALRELLAAIPRRIAPDGEGEKPCQRCGELEKVIGLRADKEFRDKVNAHIESRSRSIAADSCFSQVYKVYETGDALNGPSVVVEWDDVQVWFSCDGSVEEYPSRLADLTAQLAARDAALLAVDGELAKAQAELGVARAEIACLRSICDGTDLE